MEALPPNKKRKTEKEALKEGEQDGDSIPQVVEDILEDGETDSRLRAAELFRWLIFPVDPEVFFEEYWEKKPLVIQRGKMDGGKGKDYYKGWFSTKSLEEMIAKEDVNYIEHVDVSKYEGGAKQEMVSEGKVDPDKVWKLYKEGCSVRFRHPQQFSHRLWQLCSLLQEQFGCVVGSNSYLTPAGSQGFPPHYDDVEVFLLQLEGSKHWKLYPTDESNFLPRFPSAALNEKEIPEPLIEVDLQQGDLMYFPRGTIHQAHTSADEHSFHLTLSTYQLHSWVDFFTQTLPGALELAAEELPEIRQGLPRDYLKYMGTMNSDKQDDPDREAFQETIVNMLNAIMEYIPHDSGADQMAKKYLHESLPPYIPAAQREQLERSKTATLTGETMVRVIAGSSMRLVAEEDFVVIYHNMKNSKVFAGEKVSSSPSIRFSVEVAPALEYVIQSYPEYFSIESLPLDEEEDRIQVIKSLLEEDLILVHTDCL